jgi:hypothetical protein
MGERKVLNKYIPADFDYRLIPKGKRDPFKSCEVRMMLPFSCQCNTCGEFMYRGKKFNSRKEDVFGEDYHGIRLLRFVIKCVTCSSPITFKTDPENADYTCESGASRNFEAWKQNEIDGEAADKEKEEAEKGDAMKHLENRTIDSKKEMDIYDALDEMKAVNQRHEKVNTERLLEVAGEKHDSFVVQMSEEHLLKTKTERDADAEEARKAFAIASGVQRLEDPDSSDEEAKKAAKKKRKKDKKDGDGKKKKRKGDEDGKKEKKKKKTKEAEGAKKPEKHTFDVGNGPQEVQSSSTEDKGETATADPAKKEVTLADLVAMNVEKKKQEKKALGGAVFSGIIKKKLKKPAKEATTGGSKLKTKAVPAKPAAGLLLASYSSSDNDDEAADSKTDVAQPSAALSLLGTYGSSSDGSGSE